MPNKLVLGGFDELKRDLSTLPRGLRDQSAPVLLAAARVASTQVIAAYPRVTGNLQDGVKIVERTGRGISALYTLVSSSPHAHLYEFGTGHTAPKATFLPITERLRRGAVVDVANVVRAEGLEVTGEKT